MSTAPFVDLYSSELAVEAWPTGILIVDRSGTTVFVNRELERRFGCAEGAFREDLHYRLNRSSSGDAGAQATRPRDG